MKIRTGRNKLYDYYGKENIMCIGYCDLYYLLRYQKPFGYTCDIYGWGSDVYEVGNIIICTGYRPFGGIKIPYEIVRKYNDKAKEIVTDWDMELEEKKNIVNCLLDEFLKECLG